MNTTLTAATITGSLVVAVLLGAWLRRLLPEHHLSGDTKDTVKLAMGLVATMSALVLGLLVSSAKGSYDTTRTQVIQMAAKAAFFDRILALYGPESAEARSQLRAAVEEAVKHMWPEEQGLPVRLAPNPQPGDAVYNALARLSPGDDEHRSLKNQAMNVAADLGQLRALLLAETVASISKPLLVVVVCWLVVIFFSFSLLAPPNATALIALFVSALSVAGACFLILELDRPFGGLIQISSEPMLNALRQLAK